MLFKLSINVKTPQTDTSAYGVVQFYYAVFRPHKKTIKLSNATEVKIQLRNT